MSTTQKNNKLGKSYRLCSKIEIDQLFESGMKINCFPFTVFVREASFDDDTPFRIAFSAPKKTFRLAHERNRIKRICREVVRLNKDELESFLITRNQQVALFLIYSADREVENLKLNNSIIKLFRKITSKLQEDEK